MIGMGKKMHKRRGRRKGLLQYGCGFITLGSTAVHHPTELGGG
jgi:hypothetical protein